MSSALELNAAGRRRSLATLPGYHAGRPPRNKGLRYPADPPRVEEIVAVMRQAGDRAHGDHIREWCLTMPPTRRSRAQDGRGHGICVTEVTGGLAGWDERT